MRVREAEPEDVPAIVEMGCRFLRMTAFGTHVRENPEQMAALVTQLLDGAGVVFVADTGQALVGMVGLAKFAHPISAEPFAAELFWWVDPESRGSSAGPRLLRCAEQWARDAGVVALQMIAPDARTERVYQALGFVRVEVAYQKRLVS